MRIIFTAGVSSGTVSRDVGGWHIYAQRGGD